MSAGRRTRRTLRWLAAVAALGLLGGACTSSDDEPDPTTTTTEVSNDPVDGGTIHLGLPGPIVVDPLRANPGSPSDLMVLDLLHDGLTRVDTEGVLHPALALSWTHDPTFTTWSFALDPDATFTSGTPIRAAEVVASLQRVVAAGPGSLAALRLEAVAGITAAEDGTVQISLAGPLATLPTILAAPEMGIVAPAALPAEADADLGGLDLSGAWDVDDGDDTSLELVRRPGRDGHLDGVSLQAFDDEDAAYDAFEDGEVDWALVPGGDTFDDAVDAYGDDHFAPFQAEVFFGMRVASATLANADLRTAIAAAIDRDSIVEAIYPDRAVPLATIVPDGVAGHDPDTCSAEACSYDPAVAKAALARAYPDGAVPTVPIDYDDSTTQAALAKAVAADLDAVGIPTQLRPLPRADYKAFITTGAQELFSFGWVGTYASPDAYLAPQFSSLANDNLTGVAVADVDVALAAARATDDQDAAAAHWASAEARLLGDAVVVPIAQFRTQPVVNPRVRDLVHAVDASVDWSAVWVSDASS